MGTGPENRPEGSTTAKHFQKNLRARGGPRVVQMSRRDLTLQKELLYVGSLPRQCRHMKFSEDNLKTKNQKENKLHPNISPNIFCPQSLFSPLLRNSVPLPTSGVSFSMRIAVKCVRKSTFPPSRRHCSRRSQSVLSVFVIVINLSLTIGKARRI